MRARARTGRGSGGGSAHTGHLAVLVARLIERRVRRGPRALWGLVAKACAAAAIEEARTAGHSARRTAELVNAFFEAPGWLLPPPPLLQVAADGRDRLVRRRVLLPALHRRRRAVRDLSPTASRGDQAAHERPDLTRP
jgi:hypothetical protein